MSDFRPWTVVALVLLGLVSAGCSGNIPIGALISETGAAAGYGDSVRKGLDLAVEEINADGGFGGKSFELIYRDDQTSAQVGQDMVADLIATHDVGIIIGAVSSSVTLAVAPMCEEEKVVLLSPTASTPDITKAGFYIFRNYPSDILEGTAMANFARDLGVERMAIFAVANEFGDGLKAVFAPEFESRFRKIVATIDFPEGQAAELADQIGELTAENPDGIYIVGYLEDVASIVQQVRDAGLESVILTTSSIGAVDLVEMVGPAAESVVLPRSSSFDPESDEANVKAFVAAYREKYGEDPDDFAAHGYDSAKLLLVAMETRGSSHPDDVKFGLGAITDYAGASGRVSIDEHGDVIQYPRLFVVRQGRAVPYDQFKEEGGSLNVPGS